MVTTARQNLVATSQLSGFSSNTNEQVREWESTLISLAASVSDTLRGAHISVCVCVRVFLCVCIMFIFLHLYGCQSLLSFSCHPSLSHFLCSRSLSSKNSDPCIRSVWQMTAGADNPLSACTATVNNAVPCHRTTLAKAHISYPSQKLLLNSPSLPLPILLKASPQPANIPHPSQTPPWHVFGCPNDQNILGWSERCII